MYLAIIPNLIVIAFLLFNKNAKKKYETKKAVTHLLLILVTTAILISFKVGFYYRWLQNNKPQSLVLNILLFVFVCIVVFGPIFILNQFKINNEKPLFIKKFRVQIAIAVILILLLLIFSYYIIL